MKCPKRCATSRGYSMAPMHNFKIDKRYQRESLHRLKVRNSKRKEIKHEKKPPRAKDAQLLTH
jgi:hypothetical protein